MSLNPLEILGNALRAPRDRRALDEVSRNRQAIVDAIDAAKGETVLEMLKSPGHEDWVIQVIRALESKDSTDDLQKLAAQMQSIVDRDEWEIGTRFKMQLEQLPARFFEFDELQSLPVAPEAEQLRALKSPATLAAGRAGARLARFGMSPLTFHYAAQAASDLVYSSKKLNEAVTPQDVVDEISATCGCTAAAARQLFTWLIRAADHIDIFPGLTTVERAGKRSFQAIPGKAQHAAPPSPPLSMESAAEADMPVEEDDDLFLTH
jgi:hypothetical protein